MATIPGENTPLASLQTRWYAIQTRAKHERRIEAELQRKGIAAYVPIVTERHRWSDRVKQVEIPLFSCYVFVRMMDERPGSRHSVLNTPGVFSFVSVCGRPAAIPDAQIEAIQSVLENRLTVAHCGFIPVGQKVRISGGALDGVEGILAANLGANKMILSVELLRQSIEVTVEGYRIEPI